jgi:hypothetical protein
VLVCFKRTFFSCVQVIKATTRNDKVSWAIGSQVETHCLANVVKAESISPQALKLVSPFFAKKYPFLKLEESTIGDPDMVE